MLNLIKLINNLIGLGFYALVGLPIVLFVVYIAALTGSSFFGGPVWLWFIGILILAIPTCKEAFEKGKLKNQNSDA